MRICKVWDAEYPWDVRVEKVTRELTEAGHEVHLVARNRDSLPVEERLPECSVHRLAPFPLFGERVNRASMFPAFFNPRWIRRIQAVARETQAEVLFVRDLPLTPAAIWVGRRLGVPVVLDMAENYPAMIRSMWESGCYGIIDWFVRNPRAVTLVERWCLDRVDHVVVVVEESRDRLLRLGIPANRITIVSNTPALARLDRRGSPEPLTARRDVIEVAYLGLMEEPRGIATLIQAVAIARASSLPVVLSLYGDGRERARFEKLARDLGLDQETVRFHGYVPYTQALCALEQADIGAIPHRADESWNTTIPNKLFDYMAAGVCVLASDSPPVARVLRDAACGEVFRSGDANDAARALLRLANSERRRQLALSGRAAIRERFNWERDAARLRNLFEGLSRPRYLTEVIRLSCPSIKRVDSRAAERDQ